MHKLASREALLILLIIHKLQEGRFVVMVRRDTMVDTVRGSQAQINEFKGSSMESVCDLEAKKHVSRLVRSSLPY